MSRIEIRGAGVRFRADAERVLIGRSADCDLTIRDSLLSGRHAALEVRDGRWVLTDLGSKNGTYIGGARIDGPIVVTVGTELQVGRSGPVLRIVDAGVGGPAEPGLAVSPTPPPTEQRPPPDERAAVEPGLRPDSGGSRVVRRLVATVLLLGLSVWAWIERDALVALVSGPGEEPPRTAEPDAVEPDGGPPPVRKRDHAATRDELRRDALAPEPRPRRWTADSLRVLAAVSGDPLRAARDLAQHPLAQHAIAAREGDRLLVAVRLIADGRPFLVEWQERGVTLDAADDVVAVGAAPEACVLLVTASQREAARGSAFPCVVRQPAAYPPSVDHPPPVRPRVAGEPEVALRPRPQVADASFAGFMAADVSAEPAEVGAVAWGDVVQSLRTLDIEGTPVPLFVSLGDRTLVAGRVVLATDVAMPVPDLAGLTVRAPDLPGGAPLPALGGAGRVFVLGDRP